MTLAEYMEANGLNDRDLAVKAGWNRTYVTHLRRETKKLTLAPSLRLFRITGQRFGPLAEATAKDIAAVERVKGAA